MNKTLRITLSAMCLAIGVLLPQVTHFLPAFAKQLSLMHIPTYIAGIVCGPLFGGLVGILSPIISMMLFNMPNGVSFYSMVIELASYGVFVGILYRSIKLNNNLVRIYISLIISMIIGKTIYGICNALIFKAGEYSFSMWVGAAFVNGLLGIIVHLLIVPPLCMFLLRRIKYNN